MPGWSMLLLVDLLMLFGFLQLWQYVILLYLSKGVYSSLLNKFWTLKIILRVFAVLMFCRQFQSSNRGRCSIVYTDLTSDTFPLLLAAKLEQSYTKHSLRMRMLLFKQLLSWIWFLSIKVETFLVIDFLHFVITMALKLHVMKMTWILLILTVDRDQI